MIRELKLGNLSILKLASGITAVEPGLVSGQQVVSYVDGRLSTIGTGTWNGGTVSNPTTFDATVSISYGSWLTYGYLSVPWESIPSAAVPCKSQIQAYTEAASLARPATGQIGQVLHLTANGPAWTDLELSEDGATGPAVYQNGYFVTEDWYKSESLPPGWYKVDLLLAASGEANTLDLIASHASQTGRIKNVMGMAWNAGGAIYSTTTGTSWRSCQEGGGLESNIFASILQISFLYEHISGVAAWMGVGLTGEGSGWTGGSLRYTSIRKPEEVHNITTELPTDLPTELPTDIPTDIPTDAPADVPTEGPSDPPSEETTEIPEGFSVSSRNR